MPATYTHSLKDATHLQIVPVIASFDTQGKVTPLYVRIGSESYKVHSSWAKPGMTDIITYVCQIVDGDLLRPLELTYFSRDFLWTIPRN